MSKDLGMTAEEFKWVSDLWKREFTDVHRTYNGYPAGFKTMVEALIWDDYHVAAEEGRETPSASTVRRAIAMCWRTHNALVLKSASPTLGLPEKLRREVETRFGKMVAQWQQAAQDLADRWG